MKNKPKIKDSFVFYRSFYESLIDLIPQQQSELLNAICKLALDNEEIQLTGLSKTLFTLIKPQILANNVRYNNGNKGGRPNKKTNGYENEKPMVIENRNQWLLKMKTNGYENEKPNVNDNVNVNDNKNDNVNTPKGGSRGRFNYDGFSDLERKAITDWLAYKSERKDKYTPLGLEKLAKELFNRKTRGEDIIESINHSIANNWAGCHATKHNIVSDTKPSIRDSLHRCNDQDFSSDTKL